MILLDKVSKKYGNVSALCDISLSVDRGEVIGLLGLNGAGKTTTMKLITGMIDPSGGQILVDNLTPTTDHLQVATKIGYLPENNPLYSEMLVGEYLDFIRAIKKPINNLDYQKIIDQTGLSPKLKKKIDHLSKGFKQRVGLASALIGNPEILILDEPTSGLDPIEQEKIRQMLIDISKTKTIFFSSHNLNEVEEIATRLLILDRGGIVYDGKCPKTSGSVEVLFKKYIKPS